MSNSTITSDIIVAYSQCPRKAFLLLCTEEQGMPHEYMQILEQQKQRNQINYLQALTASEQAALEVPSPLVHDLHNEGDLVFKATLKAGNLEAYCDVLTRVKSHSSGGEAGYEPTLVVGTSSISKEQEL